MRWPPNETKLDDAGHHLRRAPGVSQIQNSRSPMGASPGRSRRDGANHQPSAYGRRRNRYGPHVSAASVEAAGNVQLAPHVRDRLYRRAAAIYRALYTPDEFELVVGVSER